MLALEKCKLFSALSESELDRLRNSIHLTTFSEDEQIFMEGDEGDGLYVIGQGSVRISALVAKDERRKLSRLGPGEFFGEMALVDCEPRSATATAETETHCYFIPRDEMLEVLESSPKLAVTLVREFSHRLREFNRQYIREVLEAERLALVGRFARSIVHEFKNPLNVIGIAADMIAMDEATLEMRRTGQKRIRWQVERLSNMITELLEFTRGSNHPVALGETDYSRYVRQLAEERQPDLHERLVTVKFEDDPPPGPVLIDTRRVVHVFQNLINNAVEAMPDGGTLKLRFRQTDKELVTEIEDSGPGIEPEILPRVFEAFATYGKTQGTGLGLCICKRIVEDHRGWIKAWNASENGGAVFAFALPLARGAGQSPTANAESGSPFDHRKALIESPTTGEQSF